MTDILIYTILPLLGSIFIKYFIFYSMKRIGTNVNVGSFKKNIIVAGYITLSVSFSLLGNGLINLLILMLIPVIGHFLYNNLRLYIVYYTGFIIALYLTDILSIILMQLLFQYNFIYFIQKQIYYMTLIITIRFIEFLVLKILVAVIRKKHHVQITLRQMVSSFIMPVFSIINLLSMMFFIQIYVSEEFIILLEVNIAMLFGLNIYFTSVFDIIANNNHLENELNLYRQQQVIQTRYYENLEKKYGNTRNLIHDIRNHIQAMEHLYEEQENTEGCGYTKDIHDMLNQLGLKYYTSSKMLNIILNDKVQAMQAFGINPDIKISNVDLSFIRDVDITTLFANILDNAIESATLSDEKQIILRVAVVHDFISVILKNSLAQSPVKHGDTFVTTKEAHEGLGLKNVERVVKDYKGDVQYEWGEQYFITRIMLAI
ncbi:Sensor histidine kinase YesM [Anaerocolumna jejuensis DSM 15929]|uniref:Sensor histidine kinase YesM n=1 Tax=Anaerocolumna jejuensis DSM 15929 TaxID=1121322 RepID=A0A1M6U515_9FIRM|nr:GHKL domain-containing protein [Anaerocolumna jejuensis]SHK64264.1 Sensor histidine kinase YesM [Anaerocolumna jejuensis DSM 15929]